MSKNIADRMGKAAQMDPALPYSLFMDALDRTDNRLNSLPITRQMIGICIEQALDAYDADPQGYWTDERKARAGVTEDRSAEAERVAGIVRYLDEEAPTAHDSLR